jgi:hypothetical protein
MSVGKNVTNVQGAAHRWGWRVDRVDLFARLRPIESVCLIRFPGLGPLIFDPLKGWLVRERGRWGHEMGS